MSLHENWTDEWSRVQRDQSEEVRELQGMAREQYRYELPKVRNTTYTPPVTPEEEEWFNEVRPWNLGSYGEKVIPRKVDPLPESARVIAAECDRIKAFLIEKNLAYGNSALQPVRIFSDASTVEQLLVRIDDKLSRMENGFEHGDDDTTLDLIGYLILLRIAVKEQA